LFSLEILPTNSILHFQQLKQTTFHMIIYKFGGASIKDAASVKKMVQIVQATQEPVIIVASAMGKTTNKLESILKLWFDKQNFDDELKTLIDYHQQIIAELFDNTIPGNLNSLYGDLLDTLRTAPSLDYNYEYDRIVSFGELFSTKIISAYFNRLKSLNVRFIDIRKVIITDRNFSNASVMYDLTKRFALETFVFKEASVYITQGFIGGTTNNQTTTLGREGSDYTAAILANVCNAQKVVVWKDVPGIMNADPAWMPDAQKNETLTYDEAVELTYYGAKVIHPKTIKPIQEKAIPLWVKSFLTPESKGTLISGTTASQYVKPVYIRKCNQMLISVRPLQPGFISQSHISMLFDLITDLQVTVHLTQMSAATFTICIDYKKEIAEAIVGKLQNHFHVRYNTNTDLITIRNYTQDSIELINKQRKMLIEQKTRKTAQIVSIKNEDTDPAMEKI
jgi:aspartate kinase